MKNLRYLIIIASMLMLSANTVNNKDTTADIQKTKKIVYIFDIKENIAPAAWRNVQKAFEEAGALKADYIIIQMNTYGGMVNIADSIRTKILNSKIPVYVFIDNNAASAGALISIATDSIYMKPSASIGAASVVNQSGQVMPDKYQSYMRATMRATAESHGKDTIISGSDTTIRWRRDPRIAEAMVDPSIYIKGIIDTGKVLTFTASEAKANGYCEGLADNLEEVMKRTGIEGYTLKKQTKTSLDKAINFLLSPVVQGILIMLILGGIYFELQTPGIGFPLLAAAIGALFYFAPLYLEGLAENWELIIFAIGLVLLGLEIFVIPGFGIAGISGVVLIVAGLMLAMVDNIVFKFDRALALKDLARSFFTVVVSITTTVILSLYLSEKMFASKKGLFSRLALHTTEKSAEGYIGVEALGKNVVGKTGTAATVLRPSGRVEIDGELYDAIAEIGFIDKGSAIKVNRFETGQVYVVKLEI